MECKNIKRLNIYFNEKTGVQNRVENIYSLFEKKITSSTALSSSSAMAANKVVKDIKVIAKSSATYYRKLYRLNIPPKAHLCEVALE